jgi:hypothetical protein
MALSFTKLDRGSIRRLGLKEPAEGKRLIEAGARLSEHGITIERLADGDLRYSVNIMVDGTRVHRVIGRDSEGVTRTQCEEFIEQARTEARSGRLNLPKGRKLALGLAAAADDYMIRLEEGGGASSACI